MSVLTFDELNALSDGRKQRSLPIDRYFDEMDLTAQQKKDRKMFAREMQNILFDTMSLIHLLVIQNISGMTLDTVNQNLSNDLDRLVQKYTVPDGYMVYMVTEYASNFVDVTVRHSVADDPKDVAYWYSKDRARLNAEDEANDIFNYDEYRQAVFDGCEWKEWISMRDAHVRKTHAEVDGEVLPIEDLFLVGESLMRFPHDSSLGAGIEELAGCRCSIRYF